MRTVEIFPEGAKRLVMGMRWEIRFQIISYWKSKIALAGEKFFGYMIYWQSSCGQGFYKIRKLCKKFMSINVTENKTNRRFFRGRNGEIYLNNCDWFESPLKGSGQSRFWWKLILKFNTSFAYKPLNCFWSSIDIRLNLLWLKKKMTQKLTDLTHSPYFSNKFFVTNKKNLENFDNTSLAYKPHLLSRSWWKITTLN